MKAHCTRTNSFVRSRATLTSSAPDQCNHTTCSTHRLGTYYTSSTLLKSTTREESGVRSTVQTPHTSHSSRLTPHTPRGFSALQDLPPCAGGAGRDRTDDLRLAKPPLSQLSYSPFFSCPVSSFPNKPKNFWWVWLDSNQRPPPYQDGALTS